MPIYEYICKTCQAAFEVLISADIEAKTSCVECGSTQVVKQLSAFSTHVAYSTPSPCRDGICPSNEKAGTGCSGGGCPFN